MNDFAADAREARTILVLGAGDVAHLALADAIGARFPSFAVESAITLRDAMSILLSGDCRLVVALFRAHDDEWIPLLRHWMLGKDGLRDLTFISFHPGDAEAARRQARWLVHSPPSPH